MYSAMSYFDRVFHFPLKKKKKFWGQGDDCFGRINICIPVTSLRELSCVVQYDRPASYRVGKESTGV